MNTSAALLQAIIAEPNNDYLRLVYADSLDDEGDSVLAEFIRTAITDSDSCGYRPYVGSPWELLLPLDQKLCWYREFSGRDRNRSSRIRIHKGLIQAIRCKCEEWVEHGPRIVAVHPVETVIISDKRPTVSGTEGQSGMWSRLLSEQRLRHSPYIVSRGYAPSFYTLPEGIFDRMPGRNRHGMKPADAVHDKALMILSTACLAWACDMSRPVPHKAPTCEVTPLPFDGRDGYDQEEPGRWDGNS